MNSHVYRFLVPIFHVKACRNALLTHSLAPQRWPDILCIVSLQPLETCHFEIEYIANLKNKTPEYVFLDLDWGRTSGWYFNGTHP